MLQALSCEIASRDGPRLGDDLLEDLATTLSQADILILGCIAAHLQRGVPDMSLHEIAMCQVDIEGSIKQIEECRIGRQNFSRNYLRDRGMLKYWRQHFQVHKDSFLSLRDTPQEAVAKERATGRMTQLESCMKDLEGVLVFVVEKGLLNDEDKAVIRGRYVILDELIATCQYFYKTERIAPSWPQVASSLRQAQKKSLSILNPCPESGQDWTGIIMWSTFLLSVIAGFPTFALGWQHSGPNQGTTSDADFWFLLQSCSMSLLGLLTMAIPMWTDDSLGGAHAWLTWSFVAIACLCTVVAPPVYLSAPTYWSAFLMTIVGSIQAWVTMQMAFVARMAPRKARARIPKSIHQD